VDTFDTEHSSTLFVKKSRSEIIKSLGKALVDDGSWNCDATGENDEMTSYQWDQSSPGSLDLHDRLDSDYRSSGGPCSNSRLLFWQAGRRLI